MDIRKNIISIIATNNGIKAREIAKLLEIEKSFVNKLLYGDLKERVFQDKNYLWWLQSDDTWNDQILLEFIFDRDHTKTTRYKSKLYKQEFVLYAPKIMLPQALSDVNAEIIHVTIGITEKDINKVKFKSQLNLTDNILSFKFYDEKVNSIRYDAVFEGKTYSMSIPREFFRNEKHPSKLFLHISLPKGEE